MLAIVGVYRDNGIPIVMITTVTTSRSGRHVQLNLPVPASILVLVMSFVFGTAAVASDRVKVGQFWSDRTEVTIGDFQAYAKANAVISSAEREGGGFE